MSFLYSIVGFIIAIGILVVVHEFGHYWVARRLGVKVLRFSVGFGKPLLTRRAGRDQTEYALSAIPLGGYVKMLDENEGPVPEAERHRAFNRQSLPTRLAIVLAGPFFNFLFAIVAYSLLFMAGVEGIKPIIGKIAPDSIAQAAGFQSGERIVSIDNKDTETWNQHRLYLFGKAIDRERVTVEVVDAEGNLKQRVLDFSQVKGNIEEGDLEGELGWQPALPALLPVLGVIEPDSPAAKAGLQVGDRILAVNGQPIADWPEAVTTISRHPGEPLLMTVDRDGQRQDITVTPETVERNGERVGRIGAGVRPPPIPESMRTEIHYTPFQALGAAVESTWSMSVLTLKVLYKMITLEMSTKSISGPITIAQYAGYSAQIGLDRFVMFLAIVSISLGVLNLLPIPILDGGHVLYYVIEAVKGSPLSERALEMGHRVGIVLLLGLMMLAFYNDFVRIIN